MVIYLFLHKLFPILCCDIYATFAVVDKKLLYECENHF